MLGRFGGIFSWLMLVSSMSAVASESEPEAWVCSIQDEADVRYQLLKDELVADGGSRLAVLENDAHGLVASGPIFRLSPHIGPSIGAVVVLINKETGFYLASQTILPDRSSTSDQEPIMVEATGVCEREN